jgi:hypothetical protein
VKQHKIDSSPVVSFPIEARALPLVCARHAVNKYYYQDVIKEF